MKFIVKCFNRGQMKIQQMAFVLMAIFIFFAMIGLVYFAFSMYSARELAIDLRDKEARELVKKIADSPEFIFTTRGDCGQCLDFDKALALKKLVNDGSYKDFWPVNYLAIERIYPPNSNNLIECQTSGSNYDDCNIITIIDKGPKTAKAAFVTLIRYDLDKQSKFKYELGRIHISEEVLD